MLFKKRIVLFVATAMLLLLAITTIDQFILQVQKNEISIADNNLKVASNNCVSQVKLTFESYFKVLESVATMLDYESNIISKQNLDKLHKIALKNGFKFISIDFFNGQSYSTYGITTDISNNINFERMKKGDYFVSDVENIQDELVVNVYFPLKDKDNQPFAALRLTISTLQLSKDIDITLFDSEGYYHIIDENGNYVAVTESENALLMDESFLSAISKLEYDKGFVAEDIYSAFTDGSSGYTKYSIDGNQRYSYYEPIGINNWVLMMIVPKDVVVRQERQNIYFAINMTIRLGIILIVAFSYVVYVHRKAASSAILNDKCFRTLAEQAGKVIFEWDFVKSKLSVTKRFKEMFGREAKLQMNAQQAISAELIHPDDHEIYRNVFVSISKGENLDNIVYRIRHSDQTYHWYRLEVVVICDQKGRPYKAIGSFEDINDKIFKENELKQKSETDQLTGLYNKITTEFLIGKLLNDLENSCALMIIDIDNFKNINDTLGHQYGDFILKKLAELIKPLFRSSDIIGRIGGDEFFVFIKGYKKEELIEEKAKKICQLVKSLSNNDNKECDISASVGISLYPNHGNEFETLYKKADLALYYTKENGKNGFTIYDKTKLTDDFKQTRTIIESQAMN